MNRNTARVVAGLFAALAFILAMLGTVIAKSRGKPIDVTAVFGALMCVFFCVIVIRRRGEK